MRYTYYKYTSQKKMNQKKGLSIKYTYSTSDAQHPRY